MKRLPEVLRGRGKPGSRKSALRLEELDPAAWNAPCASFVAQAGSTLHMTHPADPRHLMSLNKHTGYKVLKLGNISNK